MDEELWKLQHGQDLNDQLELIGLDMRMYYGGPREAVMHAIYRQNLGFTHFIIGRKHADAPFDDKTAIWGDFDAQEIFDNLGGELAISTSTSASRPTSRRSAASASSDNKDNTMVGISGTKMREILGPRRDARRARHASVDRENPGRLLPVLARAERHARPPPWVSSTSSRRRSRSRPKRPLRPIAPGLEPECLRIPSRRRTTTSSS